VVPGSRGKTAKTFGLTIASGIIAIANEVIERRRPRPLWVISGSADHVGGLTRMWQVPVNKRTSGYETTDTHLSLRMSGKCVARISTS